jgi:hypothetical protein
MGFSVCVLVDSDHAGDIKFVPYKVIQIKRLIIPAKRCLKPYAAETASLRVRM